MFGGSIGYCVGSVAEMSEEMCVLKPSTFPVVPRLLNRFNDSLKVDFFSKYLFWAYNGKKDKKN
jgi:hypothetical protein